jgi:cytochrome c2
MTAWEPTVARRNHGVAILLSFGVLAAAAVAIAAIPREQLVAANYRQGMLAFQKRCSACHSLAEGGNDMAGPNLHGLFARDAGSKPGFSFSAALEQAGGRWTPERVEAWLADPQRYIPGNQMLLPEPVPEADRIALISFLMLETGGADWPRPPPLPPPQGGGAAGPSDAPLAQRFPSFWNHLMQNTTRFRLDNGQGELRFDAWFHPDGSVTSSETRIRGFWHVNSADTFCYALYGLPLPPQQLVECFPVIAMSIPRFREDLWTSQLAGGVRLTGGIVPGRPGVTAPLPAPSAASRP